MKEKELHRHFKISLVLFQYLSLIISIFYLNSNSFLFWPRGFQIVHIQPSPCLSPFVASQLSSSVKPFGINAFWLGNSTPKSSTMWGRTGEDRHTLCCVFYILDLIASPCAFLPIREGMTTEDRAGSSILHYLFPVFTLQPTKKCLERIDHLFS